MVVMRVAVMIVAMVMMVVRITLGVIMVVVVIVRVMIVIVVLRLGDQTGRIDIDRCGRAACGWIGRDPGDRLQIRHDAIEQLALGGISRRMFESDQVEGWNLQGHLQGSGVDRQVAPGLAVYMGIVLTHGFIELGPEQVRTQGQSQKRKRAHRR